MKNKKPIHILSAAILSTSMLAAPLATLAEEDENQDVIVEETESNVSTATDEAGETEGALESEGELVLATENVIFDNLFEFVQALTNNVKLALANDDLDKAEVYVDFAEQRMAEAQALLAQDKEDDAAELFEKALEALAKAEELSNEDTEEVQDDATNKEDSEETEEMDETIEPEVDEDTENVDVVEYDDEDLDQDSDGDEIKERIGQNIFSLKSNMEKVKNPRAKEVLERNMLRALEKLEAKYGNIDDLKAELGLLEEDSQDSTEGNETEEEATEDSTSEETSTDENSNVDLVDIEEDVSILDPTPAEIKGMQKKHSKEVIKGFEKVKKGKGNNNGIGKAKGKNKE